MLSGGMMDDRDEWKRESGKSVLVAQLGDDDHDDDHDDDI